MLLQAKHDFFVRYRPSSLAALTFSSELNTIVELLIELPSAEQFFKSRWLKTFQYLCNIEFSSKVYVIAPWPNGMSFAFVIFIAFQRLNILIQTDGAPAIWDDKLKTFGTRRICSVVIFLWTTCPGLSRKRWPGPKYYTLRFVFLNFRPSLLQVCRPPDGIKFHPTPLLVHFLNFGVIGLFKDV